MKRDEVGLLRAVEDSIVHTCEAYERSHAVLVHLSDYSACDRSSLRMADEDVAICVRGLVLLNDAAYLSDSERRLSRELSVRALVGASVSRVKHVAFCRQVGFVVPAGEGSR